MEETYSPQASGNVQRTVHVETLPNQAEITKRSKSLRHRRRVLRHLLSAKTKERRTSRGGRPSEHWIRSGDGISAVSCLESRELDCKIVTHLFSLVSVTSERSTVPTKHKRSVRVATRPDTERNCCARAKTLSRFQCFRPRERTAGR